MKTTSSILSHLITRNAFAVLMAMAFMASTPALRAGDDGYVAHEWGTFTSIQGGDGVLLDWNSVATSDLPPFVYNWSHAGMGRFSSMYVFKGGISAVQRMETPVIYFYTKKPLEVDVAVQFPKGQITEWFPQAAEVGPSYRTPGPILAALDKLAGSLGAAPDPTIAARVDPPVTNSVIHWKNFSLLPVEQNSALASQLRTDEKASHYFAARTEDAAFVRVNSLESTNPAPEIEKFLFYRGLGNFQTPFKVTMNDQSELTLTNTGDAPLKHLFALAIKGDRAAVVPLGQLNSGQTLNARLDTSAYSQPAASVVEELSRQMTAALEAEGLYRSEAEAMVATWRDAWFEDQGVRILYILPRAWTDSILPVTMTPAPREFTRVMVGRAEVITPAMEKLLCKCVEGFRQSNSATRQSALTEFKAMKLGRFSYVAMRLAAAHTKDPKFYEYGSNLIQAAAKPEATSAEATQPARRLAATGG